MSLQSLVEELCAQIKRKKAKRSIEEITALFEKHGLGEEGLDKYSELATDPERMATPLGKRLSKYSSHQRALYLAHMEIAELARLSAVKDDFLNCLPDLAPEFNSLDQFFQRRLRVDAGEGLMQKVMDQSDQLRSFLYGVLAYKKISAELIRLLRRLPHIGSVTRPVLISSLGCGHAYLLPLYVYLLEEDPQLIVLREGRPIHFHYIGVDINELALRQAGRLFRSIEKNMNSFNTLFATFHQVDANDSKSLLSAIGGSGLDTGLGFDFVTLSHPNSAFEGSWENPFRDMMRVAAPLLANPTASFYVCNYAFEELTALFMNRDKGLVNHAANFPGLAGLAGGFFAQPDQDGVQALRVAIDPACWAKGVQPDFTAIKRFLSERPFCCPTVNAQGNPGFPDGYQHAMTCQLTVGISGVGLNAKLLSVTDPVKRMQMVCRELYKHRHFDDAIAGLTEFIDHAPAFETAGSRKVTLLFTLARCYMQRNNFAAAIVRLNEAIAGRSQDDSLKNYFRATRVEAQTLQLFNAGTEDPVAILQQLAEALSQIRIHKKEPARLRQLNQAILQARGAVPPAASETSLPAGTLLKSIKPAQPRQPRKKSWCECLHF